MNPRLDRRIDPTPPEEQQDRNGETGESSPRQAVHAGRGYGLRRPHTKRVAGTLVFTSVPAETGGDQ